MIILAILVGLYLFQYRVERIADAGQAETIATYGLLARLAMGYWQGLQKESIFCHRLG